MGNGILGFEWSRDWWRHVTQAGQRRDPNNFEAQYLDNGGRYSLGTNGPPIENGYMVIKWSQDWWRHVVQKGQGHDPNILGVHYLDNGWRYGLGANEARIGNGYFRMKRWPWTVKVVTNKLRAHYIPKTPVDRRPVPVDHHYKMAYCDMLVTPLMTSRESKSSRSLLQHIWRPLCRQWLEIQILYNGEPKSNQIKSNLFNKGTTRPLTLQYMQYTVNTINWTN